MLRRFPLPLVTMAFGVVVALAVIDLAWPRVNDEAELWLEAAKAAMSALAIGFFGVVVGFFVKGRDDQRERDGQLLEYRRRFLLEVVAAYGRIKATRRSLRADGLGPGNVNDLTPALLQKLDNRFEALSESQLTFERLWREVGAQDAFSRQSELRRELGHVKDYINAIVSEWENGRSRLRAGNDHADLSAWTGLTAFLLGAKLPGSNFRIVSGAMDGIEQALWFDVLPGTRHATSDRPPEPGHTTQGDH